LIGRQGVEESYEDFTRNKALSIFKDKYNREIGSYKDGNTILLQYKEDINLTLDAELQRYGEQLMINKRGDCCY
jgi:penicillin-binding protein 2